MTVKAIGIFDRRDRRFSILKARRTFNLHFLPSHNLYGNTKIYGVYIRPASTFLLSLRHRLSLALSCLLQRINNKFDSPVCFEMLADKGAGTQVARRLVFLRTSSQ